MAWLGFLSEKDAVVDLSADPAPAGRISFAGFPGAVFRGYPLFGGVGKGHQQQCRNAAHFGAGGVGFRKSRRALQCLGLFTAHSIHAGGPSLVLESNAEG